MKITLGADPEVFLYSLEKQKFISSIGKIGGSKTEPKNLGNGFALQEDNVTVEYNIPPCKTPEEFVQANLYMKGRLDQIADHYNCVIKVVPSAVFDEAELDTEAAWIFGCDPDLNAWTLEENPPPKSENIYLRSAGGHIHFGVKDLDKKQKISIVRLLDLIFGTQLAILEPQNDRKLLYGMPGAWRDKPYGLEWRTPSNYWLTDSKLMNEVGYQTQNLIGNVLNGWDTSTLPSYNYKDLTAIFNDSKLPLELEKWCLKNHLILNEYEKKILKANTKAATKSANKNPSVPEYISTFADFIPFDRNQETNAQANQRLENDRARIDAIRNAMADRNLQVRSIPPDGIDPNAQFVFELTRTTS